MSQEKEPKSRSEEPVKKASKNDEVKPKQSIFKQKKFLLILLAVFILVIVASSAYYWQRTQYDPARYKSQIELAEQAYEDMSYGKSLESYLFASEIAPNQPEAYVGIVTVLTEKHRYEDAMKVVSELNTSIENPQIATLYKIVGDAYLADGDYQAALDSYTKAYKLDETDVFAGLALESALRVGDLTSAKKYGDIRGALEEPVDIIWADFTKVNAEETVLFDAVTGAREFLNTGYPTLAKVLLEGRKEEMKDYWEGRYFLGRAYFDLGEMEKAEEEFSYAVSLGSDDYALYLYLARVNAINEDKNKAYKFYDRAVEFVDDDDAEEIVVEYTDLLIADKQYTRAVELLDQFSDQNWSRLAYVKLYLVQEDEENMIAAAMEFDPTREDDQERVLKYHEIMLNYYFENEDVEKYEDQLADLEKVIGNESLKLFFRGKGALLSDSNSEAITLFKKSIDADLRGYATEMAEKELSNLK